MNRHQFRELARIRIEEAKKLLDTKSYSGAYYLAGYAIEFALKACIAKKTKEHDFPPEPSWVRQIYTHNLQALLVVAGLEDQLKIIKREWSAIYDNWNTVILWSETSRYRIVNDFEARVLYNAVADDESGVLEWLKQFW